MDLAFQEAGELSLIIGNSSIYKSGNVGVAISNIKQCMNEQQREYLNCVEVKGMNGLSCAYIKRFFGHVGSVEDVQKEDKIVIVRFKHHSSLSKAQRYSGRVIDKQPLKIRNITPISQLKDNSDRNTPKPYSTAALKFDQDKYHQKIKYGPLDIPFHWAQSLKVVDLLPDCRARWLMHEVMLLQMEHSFHHICFGSSPRSSYSECKIKQMLINNTSLKEKVQMQKQGIQKLQLSIVTPDEISYEANFQMNESDIERKLRFMLKYHFKQYGIGNRAVHLYTMFLRNSLKPQENVVTVSDHNEPEDKKEFRCISMEERDHHHLQITVREWSHQKERSEYRSIDEFHPSKAIEIFSDSCFHKNPYSKTVYEVFRDDFDGTMENNNAADIFHQLKPYFAPNYLLIRHFHANNTFYTRLDFELRMLNCEGQIFSSNEYSQLFAIEESEDLQSQQFIHIDSVKLQKHNIVLPSFSNPTKAIYLVENYVKYYCNFDRIESSQSDQGEEGELAIFFVMRNGDIEKKNKLKKIWDELMRGDRMKKVKFSMLIICIENTQKFEELKCKNFIEHYIDQLDCELTYDIAKFYSKQLYDRSPEKFKEIEDGQNFVERTLWGLYLQKSKRKARNIVMVSLKNARTH